MTEAEAISYIENHEWNRTKPGLSRTVELLRRIGDPQKKLRFVHVTGSNGKGSTCAFTEQVLRNAGYRVGLYTSPYIEVFNERIQVNGEAIPAEDLVRITERVKAESEEMTDHPSHFEMVTAIGMQYFMEQGCDIVVLEVGMGGALDSTNVIDPPLVAAVTNIGLEHTEYLGDTLEKIALTKAGIIKPGSSVVCYDGEKCVTDIVRETCDRVGAGFNGLSFKMLTPIEETLTGQKFLWKNEEYEIGLIGPHQLKNAAMAIEIIQELRKRGCRISDEALRSGLKETRWPARFEVLCRKPLFILDGGHNPQCAQALAESVRKLFLGRKVDFLMGILADKEYTAVVETLIPIAESFVCVTPDSPRALAAEELAAFIRERGGKAVAEASIDEGMRKVLEGADKGADGSTDEQDGPRIIVAFGSLYMAGTVRIQARRLGWIS